MHGGTAASSSRKHTRSGVSAFRAAHPCTTGGPMRRSNRNPLFSELPENERPECPDAADPPPAIDPDANTVSIAPAECGKDDRSLR